MANVFLGAILFSGVLAVSGCAGLIPGLEALGSLGGGYPSNGSGQAYPYDPGQGGGYAQPVQPYYQPQPYAYSGSPEVYYQQAQPVQPYYQPQPYAYSAPGVVAIQPVPQVTEGYAAAPSGRWIDRRQQRQEERIRQGQASGQLTPREARRLHNEQAYIRGADGRMRANGNLSPQERARLNTMQNRASQDINRLRHNGVQRGPRVQPQPPGPGRPTAELHQAVQPRAATQPRTYGGRPARNDGTAP